MNCHAQFAILRAPARLAAVGSVLLLAPPGGAQTYLGPTAYLSELDRPATFLTGSLALENLEDGRLDFGLVAPGGTVIGPGSFVDSVDGDDGVIDGSGNDGHSYFGFGALTVTFPAKVREAGIVWTDGPGGTRVTFEAFGPGMVSLGLHGPFMHADPSFTGGTAEDRFYGVQDPNGIVAITLHSIDGNQSFELDHVQFDTLGSSYCTAAPNSAGYTGIQTVIGSDVAADNEVTLVGSRLPSNAFGYFIASRTQGFVAGAGGAQGNLCLGGAISRFNSGVFDSGGSGSGTLRLELGAVPSPTGLTSIQAGETWNFQTWHRDSVSGAATSNFTDAVEVLFR